MRPGIRRLTRSVILGSTLVAAVLGCVSKGAYDGLAADREGLARERDALLARVERLNIERDSIEAQFIDAQESYEDERIVRETLSVNLSRVRQRAETLDEDLGAARVAHLEAASALAAREAEIAAMQSTYDELVSDLESEVSSGQIEIERLRKGLRLNVSDDVLFASGSAELDALGREVLSKVAGRIAELRDFVEVRGHTDDRRIRGALARRYPSNWELAAARAASVVRLLEVRGVPGERLAVVSLGPNEPIVPNDSVENRARNRRIEIRLLPREGTAQEITAPSTPRAVRSSAVPPPPTPELLVEPDRPPERSAVRVMGDADDVSPEGAPEIP